MFTTCVFLCSRYAVEPVCSAELESPTTHINAASGGQVFIATGGGRVVDDKTYIVSVGQGGKLNVNMDGDISM